MRFRLGSRFDAALARKQGPQMAAQGGRRCYVVIMQVVRRSGSRARHSMTAAGTRRASSDSCCSSYTDRRTTTSSRAAIASVTLVLSEFPRFSQFKIALLVSSIKRMIPTPVACSRLHEIQIAVFVFCTLPAFRQRCCQSLLCKPEQIGILPFGVHPEIASMFQYSLAKSGGIYTRRGHLRVLLLAAPQCAVGNPSVHRKRRCNSSGLRLRLRGQKYPAK